MNALFAAHMIVILTYMAIRLMAHRRAARIAAAERQAEQSLQELKRKWEQERYEDRRIQADEQADLRRLRDEILAHHDDIIRRTYTPQESRVW